MTIVLTIIGLSLLILVHEFGHFIVAKAFGMRVEEFGIGFPPRILSKKIGETLYSMNLLPLGGFVRLYGEMGAPPIEDVERSFIGALWYKRSAVIIAGVAMNFFIGWMLISAIFFIGIPQHVIVAEVQPGSPAEQVGIKQGDIIAKFPSAKSFMTYISDRKGETIDVQIQRDGITQTLSITLRKAVQEGEGYLGVMLEDTGTAAKSFFASISQGLLLSMNVVWQVMKGLVMVVTTLLTTGELVAGFVGPVGVFGIAGEAARTGMHFFIQLLAMISLNLAVLNTIPFPALDGGRLLFILIERLKGSPLSPNIELTTNAVGFMLLIILIMLVTVRDILAIY